MTDLGLAHVYMRLSQCPDLKALERVWDGIGEDYRHRPEVLAHKHGVEKALRE